MNFITDYDPGAYSLFRKGFEVREGIAIGWMEYLIFCFAWNEI